jgi:hypothetical protein
VDPGKRNGGNCNTIYNGSCNFAGGIYFCDPTAQGGGNTGNPCTRPPSIPPNEQH